MSLREKYSTIIFVPHARAKFRKLKLSHGALLSILSIVVASLSFSMFFSVQYFTSLSRTHELNNLRTENRELQKANEQFSQSVEGLRNQLRQVEDRTQKLAIIAGIDSLDGGHKGGAGGSRNGVQESALVDDMDTLGFRSRQVETDLSVLEEKFAKQIQYLSHTPSVAPVRGLLTDGFGGRSDPFTGEPGRHYGIDISSVGGQPVRAPADGLVVKSEWANGYGNVVYLSHGYGTSTRFGHLAKFNVRPGQRIKRGDIIGYVGSTGRSTGPHLHYEVHVNGKPVNPLAYILNVN